MRLLAALVVTASLITAGCGGSTAVTSSDTTGATVDKTAATSTAKSEPGAKTGASTAASTSGSTATGSASASGTDSSASSSTASSSSSTSAPSSASTGAQAAFSADDVYFDFDQYAIKEQYKSSLYKTASAMASGSYKIVIEGHCDERGTNEYNIALGDRRAKSTRDYLIANGVPAKLITTASFGEERPQCTESKEDCWWRNRRAHIVTGK